MGLFSSRQPGTTVALIAINSTSVSGGYVHLEEGKQPTIIFRTNMKLPDMETASLDDRMLKALETVGDTLIKEGAPAVKRATGSGHVDRALVMVGQPWQETKVVTIAIQPEKTFTFTRSQLSAAVATQTGTTEDRVSSGASVIGTLLNGYLTNSPFGKEVHRAEVVMLSSSLPKDIEEAVTERVRHLYHSRAISFTAFAPVAYTVLTKQYPHEHDFLVLNVTANATDVFSVKRGLLTDCGSLPQGTDALAALGRDAERLTIEEEQQLAGDQIVHADRNARFAIRAKEAQEKWIQNLTGLLKVFASNHALPRTVFLVAGHETRDFLARALDSATLHTLWLSDEPLSVIPILPEHFLPQLRILDNDGPDVKLAMLALFAARDNQST